MKLVTVYSPSHEPLFREFFLPSYRKFPQGFSSLWAHSSLQRCATAEYAKVGWAAMMATRVRIVLEELSGPPGQTIFVSDVDVQWFQPIDALINTHPEAEIVAHDGGFYASPGFTRITGTPRVLRLLRAVKHDLVTNKARTEEPAFNQWAERLGIPILRFDRDISWSPRGSFWDPSKPLPRVPLQIQVHHAAYTFGVANKIAMMRAVKAEVEKRK